MVGRADVDVDVDDIVTMMDIPGSDGGRDDGGMRFRR
jgi:hypothetical protein